MITKEKTLGLSGSENMVQNQRTWVVAAWTVAFFVGVLLIPAATFLSASSEMKLGTVPGEMYRVGFFVLTVSLAAIARNVKRIGICAIGCGGIMMLVAIPIGGIIQASVETIIVAGSGILIGGIICVVYAYGLRGKSKQKQQLTAGLPHTQRLSKAITGLACIAIIFLAANSVPSIYAMATPATGSNSAARFTIRGITVEVISSTELNAYINGTKLHFVWNDTCVTCNGVTVTAPRSSRLPSGAGIRSSATADVNFWWDGIQYCSGPQIKYYHPNRGYYGISPYQTWSRGGSLLVHCQIDEQTSVSALAGGLPLIVGLIGLAIAGPLGATVAAIVTLVLLAIIVVVGEVVLLDEDNCIWWMVSTAYIQWLVQNVSWLLPLYGVSREAAVSAAVAAFMSCGYLRLGNTVFYDVIGAGRPTPPLDIPKPGSPQFHLRFPGGSRTCLMR